MNTKACVRCDEIKPVDAFERLPNGFLRAVCRECSSTDYRRGPHQVQAHGSIKRCVRCNLDKAPEAFTRLTNGYLRTVCKDCYNKQQRDRYESPSKYPEREHRKKGCSAETAQRIVDLLLLDPGCGHRLGIGLANLAAPHPPRPAAPAPAPAAEKPRKKRRLVKLTPEIIAFIHAAHHLTTAEIVQEVQTKFGEQISTDSVYRVWSGVYGR